MVCRIRRRTMYHIAICDDDFVFIQYIKRLFQEAEHSGENFMIYEYLSGEELKDRQSVFVKRMLIVPFFFIENCGNVCSEIEKTGELKEKSG